MMMIARGGRPGLQRRVVVPMHADRPCAQIVGMQRRACRWSAGGKEGGGRGDEGLRVLPEQLWYNPRVIVVSRTAVLKLQSRLPSPLSFSRSLRVSCPTLQDSTHHTMTRSEETDVERRSVGEHQLEKGVGWSERLLHVTWANFLVTMCELGRGGCAHCLVLRMLMLAT